MTKMSFRVSMTVRLACFAAMFCAVPATSHADLVNRVRNFSSTASGAATTSNRTFNGTGFENTSQVWDSSYAVSFGNGTLTWFTQNSGSQSFGWTSQIPMDAGGGNAYSLNPDRGDTATPFAGEISNPTAPWGTLQEVFGSKNLAYLLDGEDSSLSWNLDLYYQAGQGVYNDGNTSTMELLMLERGMNSKLGARAILLGGGYSDSIVLDFALSGTTGYSLNTLEIDNAQAVGGFGIDLNAFNLTTGQAVVGYQFFAKANWDLGAETTYNGPDFVGFVGAAPPVPLVPVPEPSTVVIGGAGLGILGLVQAARRRRRRFSDTLDE
jgi:hypothetical protein